MNRGRRGGNGSGRGYNNNNHGNNRSSNGSGSNNSNKHSHRRAHSNNGGQDNVNGNGNPCSWCGKNNHPSNKCFFNPQNPKNPQANQNGRPQQHHQNGNNRNQNPQSLRCDFCNKSGHNVAQCFQKNQGLRNQNNHQRTNNKNDNTKSKRTSNANNSCTFCSKKGHREDTCHKKNPHLKSQRQQGGSKPQIWLRPLVGSAKDYLGNGTAYQQPLRLVRQEMFKSSWYQGQEFRETALDEYMVDWEEDVLMCSCPGWSSEWCIHNSASNLLSQNGQRMWVSDRDRAIIEQGMVLNWCPKKAQAYEDATLL